MGYRRLVGTFPVIEFEDGSLYRADSKGMAATIAAGELDSKRRSA